MSDIQDSYNKIQPLEGRNMGGKHITYRVPFTLWRFHTPSVTIHSYCIRSEVSGRKLLVL